MTSTIKTNIIEKIVDAVVADGEQCDEETVRRLAESLDEIGQEWLETASDEHIFEFFVGALINSQSPL